MNRLKGQTIDWKEIFANHICDKELVLKIYKDLLILNRKSSNYKISRRYEKTFQQSEYAIINKYAINK